MQKNFPLFVLVTFLSAQSACQSFSYGPPRTPYVSTVAAQSYESRADFDTMDVNDKKDPIGTALVIGLAVAVGLGTAILVPLAVNDKL